MLSVLAIQTACMPYPSAATYQLHIHVPCRPFLHRSLASRVYHVLPISFPCPCTSYTASCLQCVKH